MNYNFLAQKRLLMSLMLILNLFSSPSVNKLENKMVRKYNTLNLSPKTLPQIKQESMERKMYKNMENCNVNGKCVGDKPGAKHVRLRKVRDKIITKKTQAHLLKEKLIGEYIRRYRLKKRGYFIAVKNGNANDPEVWGGKCPSKTDHVHMGKYKIDWENTGKYNEPKSNFKFWCLLGLSLIFSVYFMIPVPLFMGAVRTSVLTGDWNVLATWDTGIPGDGDTAVIAINTNVTIPTGTSVTVGTGVANSVAITINGGGTFAAPTSGILTQAGNTTLYLKGYIANNGVSNHNADVNGVCTIWIKSSLSTKAIWYCTGGGTAPYPITQTSIVGTSALSRNIITSDGGLTIREVLNDDFDRWANKFTTKFISDTCPIKHTGFVRCGNTSNNGKVLHIAEDVVFSVNPDYFFDLNAVVYSYCIVWSNLNITANTCVLSAALGKCLSGKNVVDETGSPSITNCVFTNSHATISTLMVHLNTDAVYLPYSMDVRNCTITNTLNGGNFNNINTLNPTYATSVYVAFYDCVLSNGAGVITKITITTRSFYSFNFYGCSLAKTDITFTAGGGNDGVGTVLLKSKLAPTIVDTASAPIQDVWIAAITGAQDGTTLTPYDTCDDFTLNTGLTNPIYLGFAKAPNSTGVWVDWCAVGTEAYITFEKSGYNQYSLDNITWIDVGTPLRNSMLSNYTSTIYLRYNAGTQDVLFGKTVVG